MVKVMEHFRRAHMVRGHFREGIWIHSFIRGRAKVNKHFRSK